ncbi:TrkA-N domain protein [uncultured archaeon]|nr:TrkA-N domain protein [uncultured archaeon]
MKENGDETFNVMALTLIIAALVLIASAVVIWIVTKDLYTDAYFILEAFFDAQNTATSYSLAEWAFTVAPIQDLLPLLAVVIVDSLSRILIVSFILAAVIDLLEYANFEEAINELRARALRGHIILCGYNEMTESLIKKAKSTKMRYVVVNPDRNVAQSLGEKRIFNILGDYSDTDVLKKAGIENARAVIFASDNSMDNVRRNVYNIGINMAVIPEQLAGLEMGEFLIKARGA